MSVVKYNSHLTAIGRKTLPVPTRWLMAHVPILMYSNEDFKRFGIRVLDYGSGHCGKINPSSWDNYDPHYRPWSCWHKQSYHVIICNYVLCVVPREERIGILKDIQKRLTKDGLAYITVRNDKPKQGWGISSKGTYQGRVYSLPLVELHKTSEFSIYMMTKRTRLE